MNTFIVIIISALLLSTLLLLRKKGRAVSVIQKALAVALLVLVTANTFFNDSVMDLLNGGWRDGIYYTSSDNLLIILRSLQAASYIILPVAVFGKGKFYKNAAVFFCLPAAVLYAFYYSRTMSYYLTPSFRALGYNVPAAVRHILLTAELVITVTLPLCIIFLQKHRPEFKGRELIFMLLALPVLIVIQLPPYAPAALWGFVNIDLPDVQLQWIALTIIFTAAVILLFRFKNRQTRLEVCWLLTLALFLNYNNAFLLGFSVKNVPFQLCNMASCFMLLAMILRSAKFFNFVFLANVTGTIIAMLITEAAEPMITSFHAVRYIYQHSLVMIAPCATMGLRIFPRLTKRAMINSFGGFSLYWAFCMIFGAYVNSHLAYFNQTNIINPFYLFDIKIIAALAPWAAFTFKPYVIFGMTFMPFVQVLVLIVFYGMTCLLFLIVTGVYRFTDDHLILRRKLIEVIEKKTGRKLKLPLEFID